MATFVRLMLRGSRANLTRICQRPALPHVSKIKFHKSGQRNLLDSVKLELQNYEESRHSMQKKIKGFKDVFRQKLEDYLDESETNIVYRHDLHAMLHLADDTEEDLTTLRNLIIRHNKNPGDFLFGPICMRLMDYLKKPDLAFEWFLDEEINEGISGNTTSIVALMDMLSDAGEHAKALTALDVARAKMERFYINSQASILEAACCCKLNTKEALDRTKKLIQYHRDGDIFHHSRIICYAAYLALKQGEPEVALDFLDLKKMPEFKIDGRASSASTASSSGHKLMHTLTWKTFQATALAQCGRLEETLEVLRGFVIETDHNRSSLFAVPFMMEAVDAAFAKCDKEGLLEKYTKLKQEMRQKNCFEHTLDIEKYIFTTLVNKRPNMARNIKVAKKMARSRSQQTS